MKKSLAFLMIIVVMSFGSSALAASDPLYPFEVKINGEAAVKTDVTTLFAEVKSAVPADASIEVAGEGQVIINVFAADASGNPATGASPEILLFEAPNGALDKLLSGSKLKAGKYHANIIANGATAKVVFTVK